MLPNAYLSFLVIWQRQPDLPNSELMCYLTVTLSPFCSVLDFNLDGAAKGEMVRENLEKLLILLHTYTYLVHIWRKQSGFSNREDSWKKEGKFEISGFF